MIVNQKSLVPMLLLLQAAFIGLPSLGPQVRAASAGLLCLADLSLNPTDCPFLPANISGQVGDTVTVAVNVQGVDSLDGLDIPVQVNPAVLQPLSISLADSIMGNACTELQSGCGQILLQSVNSTSGVVRLAMDIFEVSVPGNGNLFEINYKVLSSSGAAIIFQLGCLGASAPGTCVALANPSIVNVNLQTASFMGPLPPDFYMAARPSFQPLLGSAETLLGSTANSVVALFGTGGFAGSVGLSATPVPLCSVSNYPSWSLNASSLAPASERAAVVVLTFFVPPGTPSNIWTVNVTATSGSISHSVLVTFQIVPPPRFSISADTTTLTVHRGQWPPPFFTLNLTEAGCGRTYEPETGCAGLGFSLSTSPNVKKGPSIGYRLFDTDVPTFTVTALVIVYTNSLTHPGTYAVVVFASTKWVISTITLTIIVVPDIRANV